MVKKVVRKKVSKSKNILKDAQMQKVLLENFVSLQKVMTHLSQKFEGMTLQISELLKLFEDSARAIVKNETVNKKEENENKKLLETMIAVLDQNKVIAKSLVLMYENLLETSEEKPLSFSKPLVQPQHSPKKVLIKEQEMASSVSPEFDTGFPPRR